MNLRNWMEPDSHRLRAERNVQVVTTMGKKDESAMSFKDASRESLSGGWHAELGLLYEIRIILLLRTTFMLKPPVARLKPESPRRIHINLYRDIELINGCARTKAKSKIDIFEIYWNVNRSWNEIIQIYAIKIDFQASKLHERHSQVVS